jgi:hypothetical protein
MEFRFTCELLGRNDYRNFITLRRKIMGLILGYLLKQSLVILVVFVYGAIVGLFLLWGAGFFTKEKR